MQENIIFLWSFKPKSSIQLFLEETAPTMTHRPDGILHAVWKKEDVGYCRKLSEWGGVWYTVRSPAFVSIYWKYSNVYLHDWYFLFSPSCFKQTTHSPSLRKASRSNPRPLFSNCMQNYVTSVHCATTVSGKKNWILLQGNKIVDLQDFQGCYAEFPLEIKLKKFP